MSAQERDRLIVLHEVKKRNITQRQAAAELIARALGAEAAGALAYPRRRGAYGTG
jgi:hypothetical protein